jgi:O-antigen/teichoic acid export membrane protein
MLIFISTPLITRFFGVDNIRGSFILKFFALSILARLFWRPFHHIILAIEKHKLILYLEPLSLITMIACYYFLIPLRINEFYLGAAALPLTEFILWFFPAGVLRVWILKKKYGRLHVDVIALKIWLPLVLLIVIGWLFEYSIFALPIAFLAFVIVEYYLNVLTKDRWDDLTKPFKAVLSKSQNNITR